MFIYCFNRMLEFNIQAFWPILFQQVLAFRVVDHGTRQAYGWPMKRFLNKVMSSRSHTCSLLSSH
jgi:3-hydroxyacyl-CoA dehydrogenase